MAFGHNCLLPIDGSLIHFLRSLGQILISWSMSLLLYFSILGMTLTFSRLSNHVDSLMRSAMSPLRTYRKSLSTFVRAWWFHVQIQGQVMLHGAHFMSMHTSTCASLRKAVVDMPTSLSLPQNELTWICINTPGNAIYVAGNDFFCGLTGKQPKIDLDLKQLRRTEWK